jgi:hypothetical protein
MAVTIAEDADATLNGGPSFREIPITLSFGVSDYVTGGYAITPAQAGGMSGTNGIRGMWRIRYTGTAYAYLWEWNHTTNKLVVINPTTGAEVANGTDLSGGTVMMMVNGY